MMTVKTYVVVDEGEGPLEVLFVLFVVLHVDRIADVEVRPLRHPLVPELVSKHRHANHNHNNNLILN